MKAFLLLVCLFSLTAKSQQYHFEVILNEKDTSLYKSSDPSNYLSAKSISRKTKHSIPISIEDFPITQSYLDSLASYFQLRSYSKWFNLAVIETNDSLSIDSLNNFPFVSAFKFIGKSNSASARVNAENDITSIDYGMASSSINLVRGEYLHDNGFSGEGMTIAVLDAGFSNVDLMDIFTPLFYEARIIATRNFVTQEENVYSKSVHGTQVLSILAGNKEGEFVGTAPKANYILLTTEDLSQENLIEEYIWVQGAEYADSSGADLINSSLGYNTFDTQEFDHAISQIGNWSTMISHGARKAVEKGMLVINSAGNEGDSPWKNMLFPADEEYVLSVGAVDAQGNYSTFSSTAPAGLAFVKPNVVALGEQISISSSQGAYTNANGTSFASPVIAGLAACLWQANPNKTQFEIKEIIEKSAHQYNAPDKLIGYGIPDFSQTIERVNLLDEEINTSILFPNPTRLQNITLVHKANSMITDVKLFDRTAQELMGISFTNLNPELTTIFIPSLSKGSYYLAFVTNSGTFQKQLIVN